MQCCENETLRL